MLDERTVVAYLRAHQLVSEGVPDERLEVVDRSSVHLNYSVAARGPAGGRVGGGWFVKQGASRAGCRAIARERAAYRELQEAASGRDGTTFGPALLHADAARSVLVLELVPHGVNLMEHRLQPNAFAPAVGRAVGEVLARLHGLGPPALERWQAPPEPRVPWVLLAHRPRPATLRDASPADVEVMKLLQGSRPLRMGLERLRTHWRRQGFIHGDIRWENWVIGSDAGAPPPGTPPVSLVDWERAGLGDPCFDLGAAIAEYLRAWLSSMTPEPTPDVDRLAGSAKWPLEAMTQELRSLWRAYADGRALGRRARRTTLACSVPFAAARLVAAAFEHTQDHEQVIPEVLLMLQTASNLFAWPWQASVRAIGLEP